MNRDQVRGYAKYNGYGVSQYSVHGLSQVITKFVDYDGGAIHSRQCCFSNEENIAIAIDYYTTQLKQFLAAGYLVGRDIKDLDASQVDSGNFCQCEECRKLVAYDRTNAAPIILMTNSIGGRDRGDRSERVCSDACILRNHTASEEDKDEP